MLRVRGRFLHISTPRGESQEIVSGKDPVSFARRNQVKRVTYFRDNSPPGQTWVTAVIERPIRHKKMHVSMTQTTERLLKVTISVHVFTLDYEVANNYARALKDEETFASRRTRIDYSRRREHFRFIVPLRFRAPSKLALFFPRVSRAVLASSRTSSRGRYVSFGNSFSRAATHRGNCFPGRRRTASFFRFNVRFQRFKMQSSVLIFFYSHLEIYQTRSIFRDATRVFETPESAEDAH